MMDIPVPRRGRPYTSVDQALAEPAIAGSEKLRIRLLASSHIGRCAFQEALQPA
ncbi:MAG: hypothetical protein JJE04_21700 [Acidobacteriia bacterium]|nr:hypothetical protein [Terriglobia bacterium]